jgi:hypothetical protein
MALREKIIEEEKRRKEKSVAKVVALPVDEDDERIIDELMAKGRGGESRKLVFTKEDSDRLRRVERMLVMVLKKMDL